MDEIASVCPETLTMTEIAPWFVDRMRTLGIQPPTTFVAVVEKRGWFREGYVEEPPVPAWMFEKGTTDLYRGEALLVAAYVLQDGRVMRHTPGAASGLSPSRATELNEKAIVKMAEIAELSPW